VTVAGACGRWFRKHAAIDSHLADSFKRLGEPF
jgi:hypothetical protein